MFLNNSKRIIALAAICFVSSLQLNSCTQPDNPNWQHLDLKDDGIFGISTHKAYKQLLKGKTSNTVIVAILDSGIDPEHKALQPNLWINKNEIPANGIDDDDNGYIDDVHGWNFTGSSKTHKYYGTDILTCLVKRDATRFKGFTFATINPLERDDFKIYLSNTLELEKKRQTASDQLAQLEMMQKNLDKVLIKLGKKAPTLDDFLAYHPQSDQENRVRSFVTAKMKLKTFEELYEEDIKEQLKHYQEQLAYTYNVNFEPRTLDTDHPANLKGRFYGNNDLEGPEPKHGTHVAGIIGAYKVNKDAIQGITDNVRLMPILFSVPKGQEREKALAKAIRYAVDNGAKVINMSFGDYYTWNRSAVDSALEYAASKDVICIHATGNDNIDLDERTLYPNPNYLNGGKIEGWIRVSASDRYNDENLKATFSNYGHTQVDVFAPGVRINSTIPGSMYKRMDGTSMSAPIVAGIAALIRSYYPALTAIQVKDIIMTSVTKANQLKTLCVSGGVVNAYAALQLAEAYSKKDSKN